MYGRRYGFFSNVAVVVAVVAVVELDVLGGAWTGSLFDVYVNMWTISSKVHILLVTNTVIFLGLWALLGLPGRPFSSGPLSHYCCPYEYHGYIILLFSCWWFLHKSSSSIIATGSSSSSSRGGVSSGHSSTFSLPFHRLRRTVYITQSMIPWLVRSSVDFFRLSSTSMARGVACHSYVWMALWSILGRRRSRSSNSGGPCVGRRKNRLTFSCTCQYVNNQF